MHPATVILSLCGSLPWSTVAFHSPPSRCGDSSCTCKYKSRLLGAEEESSSDSDSNTSRGQQRNQGERKKRIVIIRHGCTYMNEYLSQPGSRWGDAGFTDIFDDDPARHDLFRDSPLSERGIRQAKRLGARLGRHLSAAEAVAAGPSDAHHHAMEDRGLDPPDPSVVRDIELVACSPLTRALQTTELSLVPHLETNAEDGCPVVPIVALPLCSERVYLVSDQGRATDELARTFPCVDFESAIDEARKDCWWFTYDEEGEGTPYVEWRPNAENQTYACHGEPELQFNARMAALYDWLEGREESTIALVCHWGVIDWLTGDDFENCEMKVVPFESMKRTGFMLSDAEAAELFAKGERTVVLAEDDERR